MFSQRHSVFVFVLSLCTCVPLKINAHQQYNRLSADNSDRHFLVNINGSDTKNSIKPHNNIIRRNDSDSSNNNNNILKYQQHQQQRVRQEQTEWKPLTAQKNWFVMQATEATIHRNQHKQSQLYQQSHQQQQQQQQQNPRLPVNYYDYNHRYNHSNGNYKQVVTQSALPVIVAVNVNSNVSNSRNNSNNIHHNQIGDDVVNANHQRTFVLAIDKSMKHNSLPKRSSHPQHDKNLSKKNIIPRNIDFVNGNTFMSSDAVEQQQQQLYHQKEVSSMDITTNAKYAAETAPTKTATDDDNDYVLNEFLVPFELALEKVRNFCESAKSIINNNDIESVNSHDDESDNGTNDIATARHDINNISTNIASSEVQGRHNVAAEKTSLATSKISSSSISSLSTFAGSSRKVKKLKRKFKKLLLPLLIAYKLKFLTLIPVLIGGLTLLVGTTGLAGFFFALFTAVMSLKSTSASKSLIVKKII